MKSAKTLQQVLATAVQNATRGLRVSLVGEIITYDPETRTAEIQPVVANDDGTIPPPLLDVPVVWPGGGGYTFHATLAQGDYVTLVVSDSPNSDWHEGVDNSVNRFNRSHDWSDAIAFPVVHRQSNGPVSTSNLAAWFGLDSSSLLGIGVDTVIRLGSEEPADHVALASLVLAEMQSMKAWMDTFTAWAIAHTHAAAPTAPLPPWVGGNMPAPTSAKSDKVRSD